MISHFITFYYIISHSGCKAVRQTTPTVNLRTLLGIYVPR